MYTVKFDTRNASSIKPSRNWEQRLEKDYIEAIDAKEFSCVNDEELKKRLDFIAGHTHGELFDMMKDSANYIDLESPYYGKQRLPLTIYGFAQGYVSTDCIIKEVKEKGFKRISFTKYYDNRQRGAFIFRGCYVVVTCDSPENNAERSRDLRKTLLETIEEYGWSYTEAEDGCLSIRQHTPAGEDFSFDIDGVDIASEVQRYYADYDAEEHAAANLGCNGAPGLRALLEDADALGDMLRELANALRNTVRNEKGGY